MLRVMESNNLDWHRNKALNVKAYGTAALISMERRGVETLLTTPNVKCVWPSYLGTYEGKVLSRRVWGKSN